MAAEANGAVVRRGLVHSVCVVADLLVDGGDVVLHMHAVEKAEGFHGDIRLPLVAVDAVRAVDDPWPELRGIRAPGTGVPGVVAVGTRRGAFGKDFAAVHGKGAAVVVELSGVEYGRLVVTCDDAAAVATRLEEAVHAAQTEGPGGVTTAD